MWNLDGRRRPSVVPASPQLTTTEMTSRVPATDLVRELSRLLPAGHLLHDEESLGKYSHDDAEWAPFTAPLAVVLARSTAEVAAVVSYAADHGIHVVPRGAGTGLSGGANSVENCLIVSLELMTSILEIDTVEGLAVAQAGVINDDLRRAVAEHGLWYPPDPASSKISTIGGNAATNAGGICCVKYGVTRDYVRGMTVVLADGEIVHLGRRTAKGVTGYDLTSLLVGSEGTLGIITDVTVKLLPLAGREEQAIIGYFPTLRLAGDAVAAVTAEGIVPAALELIDSTCLRAVDDWMGLGLPEDVNVLLMAKIDEPGTTGAELASRLASIFHDAGGTNIEQATDPTEIERLFLARRMAYPSLERLGPVLTEDVCVPRHAVPEMLARIQASATEHDVVIANIAHAGDGNLHPLIIAPVGDDAAKARAKTAFDRIVDDCRDLGGTVTGEHGVGLLKLPGAAAELEPRVITMHQQIKNALDPHGILNPGKAFPAPGTA